MVCPYCSFESTRVVDSRLTEPGDATRRRRECGACGKRFTTYERVEEVVTVVKRDGRRERFDRQKLLRGLGRAAGKRPVSEEQLDALADAIAAEVRGAGPDVEAGMVGDLAERGLARLDPVSAIQFASVYRNLADLDELAAVVQRYRDEALPGSDQLALEGAPVPSAPEARIGGPPRKGQGSRHQNRRSHAGKP